MANINLEQSGGGGAAGTTLSGTGLARQTGVCTELSGDVTTSGSNATTLKNTGTAGTYTKVTFDAQGRETSGTTLSAGDIPAIPESGVTNLTTDLAACEKNANKDVASGYAGLDASIMLKPAEFKLARNNQTGTSYAIVDGDRAKVIEIANATASTIVALTIAQAGAASAFLDGWYCYLINKGSNAARLTPTTSTIGGCASMFIPVGASCLVYSDGTNYQVVCGGVEVLSTGAGVFNTGGGPAEGVCGGAISQSVVVTNPTGGANKVAGTTVFLKNATPIVKATVIVQTLSAGGNLYGGWFDSNGNRINSVALTTASAVVVTASFTASVLLLPGAYFTCFGSDNTVATSSVFTASANLPSIINKNLTRHFTAANSISAGSLPATLGALTVGTENQLIVFYEG